MAKTLMEKMIDIMADVQKLQKDDMVEFGKTKYKALSEEKVTSIMHDQIVKNKIVIYPVKQDWSRSGTITHVDVTYRIVNAEDPADYIEVVSCGDGADTQDKGSGKAMTYAFKYMWLRTFALPTGEDPDKISSAELDDKAQKRKQSALIDDLKVRAMLDRCNAENVDIGKLCALYKVSCLEELTEKMFSNINLYWDKVLERCGA